MFFRKAKRIKELEKENGELRRLNYLLRQKNKFPLQIETLKIDKISSMEEFSNDYHHRIKEDEVKRQLVSKLRPFIKIEHDYDDVTNKYLIRASIRVVKER